jgi:hypothetical protein
VPSRCPPAIRGAATSPIATNTIDVRHSSTTAP